MGCKILSFVNPLSDMPILDSFSSTTNKNMKSEMWINGDTDISKSRKHCGKRRNCSLRAISPFPPMFSKALCSSCVEMSICGVKG